MSHFSVAGLQLELSNQDNLYLIQSEIEKTALRFPWVDMIVLGELATFGVSPATAQAHGGDADQGYCELARKHNIWLLPGSYFEQANGHTYNTAPVINPEGEVVTRYRKMFLFEPYETGCSAGEEFAVFDVPGVGRMGLCICYDQWFPEVSRTLAWMGAEVIICPTLTNTIDRDIELAISRAAAAINQCYYVNINSGGKLGMGKSTVIGPDGAILHQSGTGYEVIPLELDLGYVSRTRERGALGLGQSLKSFRDRDMTFPPYAQGSAGSAALQALGPVQMPERKRHTPSPASGGLDELD
jgi:predicted amidohydrolase